MQRKKQTFQIKETKLFPVLLFYGHLSVIHWIYNSGCAWSSQILKSSVTALGLWRLPPRLCIATGGRARDVTHSINKQRFVNKCNNSNSCKVFYLDYKTMLIHKLPQTPYTAFPLDIAGLSAGKYSLFCIQHIYFFMSDGTCWETKLLSWNNFHSCHPSTFVQVSSSSRDRKRPDDQVCIGEAFSKLAKYE